jgi:hypothetical protein
LVLSITDLIERTGGGVAVTTRLALEPPSPRGRDEGDVDAGALDEEDGEGDGDGDGEEHGGIVTGAQATASTTGSWNMAVQAVFVCFLRMPMPLESCLSHSTL